MKPIYVYPGSFSPPTYGHLYIVRKAAEIFPEVYIVCSTNPNKNNLFTEEECVALWRAYELPDNVSVYTFGEFVSSHHDTSNIVMIRGVRGETDLEDEKKVLLLNWETLGIDKYFYIMANRELCDVSSTRARAAAKDLDWQTLAKNVAPLVVSRLIEKIFGFKRLFMVVGRPASGKSTFVRELTRLDSRNIHINADDFNHRLRPVLEAAFSGRDLHSLALEDEESLKAVIVKPWFELLRDSIIGAPCGSNVFVEIPFGMQEDKKMFRFVGGRVIYVGCDAEQNNERLIGRNTPELAPFVSRILGWEKTSEMAGIYRLDLVRIETNGDIDSTKQKAFEFDCELKKEEEK